MALTVLRAWTTFAVVVYPPLRTLGGDLECPKLIYQLPCWFTPSLGQSGVTLVVLRAHASCRCGLPLA